MTRGFLSFLKMGAKYAVFNVRDDDVLYIRSKPNREAEIVGAIPYDAYGIKVIGAGLKSGRESWAPIKYRNISGWVNQNYLHEESHRSTITKHQELKP